MRLLLISHIKVSLTFMLLRFVFAFVKILGGFKLLAMTAYNFHTCEHTHRNILALYFIGLGNKP